MVKTIFKLLGMAKTGIGLAATFIGLNKILVSAIVAVITFIGVQQYRINSKDTTIAELKLEEVKKDAKIKKISKSNKVTKKSLDLCEATNKRINENLINAKNKNSIAIININKLKSEHYEKIELLKEKINPVTVCDNNFIDDDFSNRMREN